MKADNNTFVMRLKKRSSLIVLLLGVLCLMGALVQMKGKHHTILALDMMLPSLSSQTSLRQHYHGNVSAKSLAETVNEAQLNEFMEENINWTESKESDKFMIYLCDGKVHCYGLADRERGIAFSYLLALLTNRKFGVMMTSPVPLENYFVPNMVDWVVTPDDVAGLSSIEISLLGARQKIGLNTIDFNKEYPQDVVYLRTNRDIGSSNVYRNQNYRFKLTSWNIKTYRKLFAKIWIALMKPSNSLRRQLNSILVEIAQTMKQEELFEDTLKRMPCVSTCELLETDKNIWDTPEFNVLTKQADVCIQRLKKDIRSAPSSIFKGENQETLLAILNYGNENELTKSHVEEEEEEVDIIPILQDLCEMKSVITPNISEDAIWASKAYDFVDLELVCVHVRLGNNPTMPWEKGVRNTLEDTSAIWEFLRPYVALGHHIFLASDAEQVRLKGKAIFGSKLHINKDPVIHIDKVEDGQDERKGMDLAMTEQLLLMTSCRTLVVSESGFSQRAAMIRRQLLGLRNVYLFRKSTVLPWAVHF